MKVEYNKENKITKNKPEIKVQIKVKLDKVKQIYNVIENKNENYIEIKRLNKIKIKYHTKKWNTINNNIIKIK